MRGKRLTKEEDTILKEAVYSYITDHNLGEDGLERVLQTRKYSQLRGCWGDIGAAISYRPYVAVYSRAQVLFRRSDKSKRVKEEIVMIREHQAEQGNRLKNCRKSLGHIPDMSKMLGDEIC